MARFNDASLMEVLKSMQVLITGKNIDIGTAIREHIEGKLSSHVEKYYDRATSAHVTIEKQNSSFRSECILHLSTGLTLHAKGEAGDAYSSFDQSLEHLEKRLRRYKRRLRNHHRDRKNPIERVEAKNYVLSADMASQTEEEPENPIIIAESVHQIPHLSVGEAAMKMDLSDASFVLFKNDKNDQINIVYKRDDDNIGWIDPSNKSVG